MLPFTELPGTGPLAGLYPPARISHLGKDLFFSKPGPGHVDFSYPRFLGWWVQAPSGAVPVNYPIGFIYIASESFPIRLKLLFQ